MVNIGINGLGRIGKCTLYHLINNNNFSIKCINIWGLDVDELEDYIMYDSTHKLNLNIVFKVLDKDLIMINNHKIKLFHEFNASYLDWALYNCNYVIDATGAHLTTETCKLHNCKYVIMSAPPKDNTKTYIYGVNDNKYNGEKIISGSSCTSNAISPILKLLDDKVGIKSVLFTTIHAATGTQHIVDTGNNSRISRSVLNNIIPHSTGASTSVETVIPSLKNKIHGSSIRVPVVNCSVVDLTIELEESISLSDIKELVCRSDYYKKTIDIFEKNLVSSDFLTNDIPCIIDINASMDIGNGKFKLIIWYDNEWSYSAQLVRLIESISLQNNLIKEEFLLRNQNFENKKVVCRFDYNVPIINGDIIDDFRIKSSISTIKFILSHKPKCIFLVSHLGRPAKYDDTLSLKKIVPLLEKYLDKKIIFLKDGLNYFNDLELNWDEFNNQTIVLLENIRFHREETNFNEESKNSVVFTNYGKLGDIYVSDAFGCVHRNHMTISGFKYLNKPYCIGNTIESELNIINEIFSTNKKILGLIGGNKIVDKLPIINTLKELNNSSIFIGGGLAKHYMADDLNSNIYVMKDGYGNKSLELEPIYIFDINKTEELAFDIGDVSLYMLNSLIDEADIIFWNGALGIIEDERYRKGSECILNKLLKCKNKTIIIGGGDTSSLLENKDNTKLYISTGGGALLEYIEKQYAKGDKLPGLECFFN